MDMTREEFEREKNDAANRIREMYKGQSSPAFPSFVSLPTPQNKPSAEEIETVQKPVENKHQNHAPCRMQNNLFKFLNFSEILKSPDALLILGIILLLISDNADEKLILALVFILL